MVSKRQLKWAQNRYKVKDGKICIELRVNNDKQLFDYRDPAPFRERDLDDDAVDYIVSAVREFPLKAPVKLIVHIGAKEDRSIGDESIKEAITSYFLYEEELARKKIRNRLNQGQIALVIATFVLTSCLLLTEGIPRYLPPSFMRNTLIEGLTISGWVSMWYPTHIFLYEWWPLEVTRRYYTKLGEMEIEIR